MEAEIDMQAVLSTNSAAEGPAALLGRVAGTRCTSKPLSQEAKWNSRRVDSGQGQKVTDRPSLTLNPVPPGAIVSRYQSWKFHALLALI